MAQSNRLSQTLMVTRGDPARKHRKRPSLGRVVLAAADAADRTGVGADYAASEWECGRIRLTNAR